MIFIQIKRSLNQFSFSDDKVGSELFSDLYFYYNIISTGTSIFMLLNEIPIDGYICKNHFCLLYGIICLLRLILDGISPDMK